MDHLLPGRDRLSGQIHTYEFTFREGPGHRNQVVSIPTAQFKHATPGHICPRKAKKLSDHRHPDRMAVIGKLFGLTGADVARSRVLELGCGNGNNLVPMAWTFPESEFVGVDLAGKPIATGQQMIHELGLSSVRLLRGAIAEIDESWGKFDYIIAHVLFSWVPPKVQESILRLSKRLLSPEGMAFVSYNAFPGGHLRSMIREMLLFHLRGERSPSERVQEGKAFLRFLAGGQEKTDEYRLWLKAELGRVLDHSEGHFFHDELAEINQPFYFTQFIERAAGNDLQYVGEADYFEMSDYIFTEPVQQTLQSLGRNRILREQYLDFLKCRCFRQTLLCHRDVKLWNEANPAVIRDFHVSLRGAVANNAPGRGENTQFETSKGARWHCLPLRPAM